MSDINKEINIGIVGIGGGGCNSLLYVYEELHKFKFLNLRYFAINTDKQALDTVGKGNGIRKILIGDASLEGFGTGAKPIVGYGAMRESIKAGKLNDLLNDGKRILFISAGLGGGTGSGGVSALVDEADKRGIISIVFGTYPFNFEGPLREKNALLSLNSFYKTSDSTIIINNDVLLGDNNNGDIFFRSNEILRHIILTFANMILEKSHINLDFNDFRNAITKSKLGLFYMQETKVQGRDKSDLWDDFIKGVPQDLDFSKSKSLVINFSGRKNTLSLAKINEFINKLHKIVSPDINVLFGISYNQYIQEDTIKFSSIFTEVGYTFLTDKELNDEAPVLNDFYPEYVKEKAKLDSKRTELERLERNKIEQKLESEKHFNG